MSELNLQTSPEGGTLDLLLLGWQGLMHPPGAAPNQGAGCGVGAEEDSRQPGQVTRSTFQRA